MVSETPREPVFDADNPEWSDADVARAQAPEKLLPPEVLAAFPRTRGPQKAPTKAQVTLRIDAATLERIRATGKGWQSRINAVLAREFGK